ncbi:putative high affinity immunoglobulin epsilon receptor subunit gamma-like isoform 2 [Scophthalmus maximus]|nr:putative high affinity immunoglobulin epsilon receptor subunit gamma-like isoform 2 [Scophthalmus maximus]
MLRHEPLRRIDLDVTLSRNATERLFFFFPSSESLVGGWRQRRVVSQLQIGQRATDFLLPQSSLQRVRLFFLPDLHRSNKRSISSATHLRRLRALVAGQGLTMVCFLCAEAIENMITCYVLDGILILYGIVLTVLYCRLRTRPAIKTPANFPEKQPADQGVYAGLYCPSNDVYETIRTDKKSIV